MTAHTYRVDLRWTGNLGTGTSDYRAYSRDHSIEVRGKPAILASSGLSANSDPSRLNPDELLVMSLSSCHMLWYLHLCSAGGVVVTAYADAAEGVLVTDPDGGGRFVEATLRPTVRVSRGSLETARHLHELAHAKCFIANSVNFPVRCEPTVEREPSAMLPRAGVPE
jgi:organic hydroperoxide reductase OsmC/OhrA